MPCNCSLAQSCMLSSHAWVCIGVRRWLIVKGTAKHVILIGSLQSCKVLPFNCNSLSSEPHWGLFWCSALHGRKVHCSASAAV